MTSAMTYLQDVPQNLHNDLKPNACCDSCSAHGMGELRDLFRAIAVNLEGLCFASQIPERTTLFVQGGRADRLHLIDSGYIKLEVLNKGRPFVPRIVGSNTILGLDAALHCSSHEVSAIALTSVLMRSIDRCEFLAFVRTHSEVERLALRYVALQYRELLRDLNQIGFADPASVRIGRLLVALGHQIGEGTGGEKTRFPLLFKHEELGDMTCTARETVTRTLTAFRRKGWIDIDDEFLTVHQPQLLMDG